MLNNTITIQNPAGQEVASFPILRGQSIADAADRAGHAIPTACCAGACNVCMCRVISGGEHIDIGLKQVPMIDVEADEVLTCVG
jgi:ferredoxin